MSDDDEILELQAADGSSQRPDGLAPDDRSRSTNEVHVEVVESNGSDQAPPVRYAPRTALDAAGQRMSAAFHWALLIVCGLTLAASIVLDVQESSVTTPLLPLPLPGICTFRRMTGLDCPGCGLTRCFISVSHGRLGQAWLFNPAGLFLYAAVVFQIPFRIAQLRRVYRGAVEIDLGWAGPGFLTLTAFLLVLQWAAGLFMLL